jgi:16S rRNA (uracil1498-N3)-methyltransferase
VPRISRVLSVVPLARPGQLVELDSAQAHHVRDVLRLKRGDAVELFDAGGNLASASVEELASDRVIVRVITVQRAVQHQVEIVVASAVPKGDRADWMVEKLSELGVRRFIPLKTARSVVLPAGKSKFDRWQRIAAESAKQSRRVGVMQIDPVIPISAAISSGATLAPPAGATTVAPAAAGSIFLTTESHAPSLLHLLSCRTSIILLLIGPEGGWTDAELNMFRDRRLTGARLTASILRIETAAVAAAAVAAVSLNSRNS